MARSRPANRPLATVFDEVPTLYARYRPGYPPEAVDALVALSGLSAGASVVEIGPGPGTLTRPLLERGLEVTAVEPGPRMAAALRRRLGGTPGLTVVESTFEEAQLEAGAFDGVVSATAFHWVDPERRYDLVRRVLRPGGALGLIRYDHVLTSDNEAYHRGVRPFFEREYLSGGRHMPPDESDLARLAPEMTASGGFEVVAERRFSVEVRRTAEDTVGLLRTYSPNRALPAARRARLLAAVRSFIEDELGGSFVDRLVVTVCVGR